VSSLDRFKYFRGVKTPTAKFLVATGVIGAFLVLVISGVTTWLSYQNTSKDSSRHIADIDKNSLPSLSITGATLGSTAEEGLFSINVPTNIKAKLVAGGGITTNNTNIDAGTGKVTASNIIYSITPGPNVTFSGDPQNPTLSVATVGAPTGTANRITVTGSQVDIASTYSGQSSINKVGTLTSGVWQASQIGVAYLNAGSCGLNEFIQAINGSLTCGTDQLGGSSPQQIKKDNVNFQTASELNFVTADIAVATGGATQVNLSLANTAVSAGSYPTNASYVSTFSVDAKGRLTAAGSTSIAISGTQITSGTINDARLSANVSLLGSSIDLASEVTGTLPASSVGTGLTDAQVSDTLTSSLFVGSG
ncbi:MAG: hypothetical protein Q7T74_03600, partial [Candidatus Saccharibacteria bacterium]|nr:hypothetical protein [Candidatus Saccharibacteria bacterium]